MNKNNYLKLLFVILLLSGSFFGCVRNDSQNNQPTTNGNPAAVTNNNTSKTLTFETTYNEFKNEKNKFLEELKKAITDKSIHLSVKSDKVGENLKSLQKEITSFRQKEADKLEDKNKQAATEILDKIDNHLKEISEKVIEPLKNGLKTDKVEVVQKQLDFFGRRNVADKYYGNYGTVTYEEIEKFLNKKQTELDKEIKALNAIINPGKPGGVIDQGKESDTDKKFEKLSEELNKLSEELNAVKKDNQRFKLIFIISGVIAGGLILFFVDKNRRISKKFGKGLSEENKEALNKLQTGFDHRLGILQEQQNTINKQIKKIDQTVISSEKTLVNRIEKVETKIRRSGNNQAAQPSNYNPSWHNQTSTTNNSTGMPVTQQPSYSSAPQSSHTNAHTSNIHTPNYSSTSVPSNAIKVSEAKLSQDDRRLGKSKDVILEKNRRGNYLVYTEGSYEYLVPSENLRINEFNYKTFEVLFEINNFHPSNSTDFKVVHPAVVNSISGDKKWQLKQRGVLQF